MAGTDTNLPFST